MLTPLVRRALLLKPFLPSSSLFQSAPKLLKVLNLRNCRNLLPVQTYATKKAQAKTTSTLIPKSQLILSDEAAQEEYSRTEEKMRTSVEWFRKECVGLEGRASGRVTPALLANVRVDGSRLEEVATVGVREGTTLVITAFEENTLKSIEQVLYDAKIPGVVPQRQDARTIKIPIPRPTVETRKALYTSAHRKAEEIRVQIRKHHQAGVKRGKFEKHSSELEAFQKLSNQFIREVDGLLMQLKEATGSK